MALPESNPGRDEVFDCDQIGGLSACRPERLRNARETGDGDDEGRPLKTFFFLVQTVELLRRLEERTLIQPIHLMPRPASHERNSGRSAELVD